MNPDCAQGKHQICPNVGWNMERDEPTECPCTCHTPETETTP